MKQKHVTCAGLLLLFLFSNTAASHGRFILPTHTVLSGKDPKAVSLIASISNDIFHPDTPLGDNGKGVVPTPLRGLFKQLQAYVIGPDGQKYDNISWQAHERMSVADYTLADDGTYRIVLQQSPTAMTTFNNKDGTPGRAFGNTPVIPEGVTKLTRRMVSSRVEAFISKNAPNRKAMDTTGVGLELIAENHFNDLFVNEPISMTLLLDGKSLQQGSRVYLLRSGTRHRNQREEQIFETDNQGNFEFTIRQPGFYLLETEVDIPGSQDTGIDFYHHSLYITLEVFPE
ncbi:MAG: DUF4198 domain-containing protein [Gammaproteobacteria bacterium]